MTAGRGAPSPSRSRRRKRAVGALPMATTEPSRMGSQRSTAAAERVVAARRASAAIPGSPRKQYTRFPAGRRSRITPSLTMRVSVSTGRPSASAARPAAAGSPPQSRSATTSGMPQACTMRTATSCRDVREAREVGLGAHDLERAPVDLVRVAEVVGGRAHRDPGSLIVRSPQTAQLSGSRASWERRRAPRPCPAGVATPALSPARRRGSGADHPISRLGCGVGRGRDCVWFRAGSEEVPSPAREAPRARGCRNGARDRHSASRFRVRGPSGWSACG